MQIAKHYREAHFGGNWTWVSLREHLDPVTQQQAVRKLEGFNTIAALAYHIHYYVKMQLRVLEGGPLEGNDELSWETPEFADEAGWRAFLEESWSNVEKAAALISSLPETRLWETFVDDKYGNYYRNLHGNIEHVHYHTGQIVLLRKMMGEDS